LSIAAEQCSSPATSYVDAWHQLSPMALVDKGGFGMTKTAVIFKAFKKRGSV
jgi:hypothetical protein